MNVTFDESPPSVVNDHRPSAGKLVNFLLDHHIVHTISQAQALLLTLAIIILIAAGTLGGTSLKSDTIDTRKNFIPAVPTG